MKKKMLMLFAIVLAFAAGVTVSAQVHDWHDLDEVHKHIVESIHEMEHARAANHYDMAGHGEKAERALREAEHELSLAVDAARNNSLR